MSVYIVYKQGNDVDMKEPTVKDAIIYGAQMGVLLYIALWIIEIVKVYLWRQ